MKLIQEKITIVCGVLLLVLPFTGFPRDWKSDMSVCIGIVIIYTGALLYKKASANDLSENTERTTKTFTETI